MADPGGRPPSYPSVVTTPVAAAGGGGTDVHPSAAAFPPTLGAALRLYERGGHAAASLDACRRLWAAADEASDKEEGTDAALARRHNEAVLGHLSSLQLQSAGKEPAAKEREELSVILSSVLAASSKIEQSEGSAANNDAGRGHNELVGLYNVCLAHYAAGRYEEALDIILSPFLSALRVIAVDAEGVKVTVGGENEQAEAKEVRSPIAYLAITTRIAFLVLDCQLALDGGNGVGYGAIVASQNEGSKVSVTAEKILAWVEKNALSFTAKGDDVLGDEYETMKHEELKFRLHLYRSRLLFVGSEDSGDTSGAREDLEGRTKTARKELKNAMDIFMNVLCVDGDGKEHGKKGKHPKGSHAQSAPTKGKGHQDVSDTTSVTSLAGGSLVTAVSDALWSEGKGGAGVGATFEGIPHKNAPSSPPSSDLPNEKVKRDTPALQVRHESVLYLKANLEQLRGNPSKSLKLCTEARLTGRNGRTPGNSEEDRKGGDDETSGPNEKRASSDADANDNRPEALYDEAIYYNNLGLLHQSAGKIHLALQYYDYALFYMERVKALDNNAGGQHFWSDGVARPDVSAEILHNKAICAFQAQEFRAAYECMARCVKISPNVFGRRARCWLRLAQSCIGIHTYQTSEPDKESTVAEVHSFDIGSEEDMNIISSQPLQKAAFCLQKAIDLCSDGVDVDAGTASLNEGAAPSPKDADCFEAALVTLAYVKLQMEDNSGALDLCQRALRENGENKVPSVQMRQMAEMYTREATARAG